MTISEKFWRSCSSCKKEISYSFPYFECSVSTCTRKRTGMVFCSVNCWERHLPGARHRDAAAIQKQSPSFQQWKQEMESSSGSAGASSASDSSTRTPQRKIVRTPPSASGSNKEQIPKDILIVASKLKNYIRMRSDGMNTSSGVMDVLSDKVRELCDEAIESAKSTDGKLF